MWPPQFANEESETRYDMIFNPCSEEPDQSLELNTGCLTPSQFFQPLYYFLGRFILSPYWCPKLGQLFLLVCE